MRRGQEEDADLPATLERMDRRWHESALLRSVYRGWFEAIADRVADVPGEVVELGSGIAKLREHIPGLVCTDVAPTRFSDRVVDGTRLPYADASLRSVVMLDVFHHLAAPGAFLDELQRTLRPGGRLVAVEPYCSTVSSWAYGRFHAERLERDVDPFAPTTGAAQPWDANLALPTVAFFDRADELERRWPRLRLVERRLLSTFVYPLSGGFTGRSALPAAAYRLLAPLDDALARRAGRLLAFRCLVVLEAR